MTNYPRWFVPWLLATLLAMLASGLLLAPGTLALRTEWWSMAWHLPGNARVPVAALHAAGGFASMLLMGALWSMHMRSGWRRRRQRVSGTVVGVMLLLLAATAVAVYYLGDETLAAVAALTHLVIGLGLVGPFMWHWLRGRRSPAAHRRHASAKKPHA